MLTIMECLSEMGSCGSKWAHTDSSRCSRVYALAPADGREGGCTARGLTAGGCHRPQGPGDPSVF